MSTTTLEGMQNWARDHEWKWIETMDYTAGLPGKVTWVTPSGNIINVRCDREGNIMEIYEGRRAG